MKNRFNTSMRRVFFLILAFAVVNCVPVRGASPQEDLAIINAMKQRLGELQQQIFATHDYQEKLRLQKVMAQTIDDVIPQLTPKSRAGLLITLKISQPIGQEAIAFTQALAQHTDIIRGNYPQIKSLDEIAQRIATINQLIEADRRLITHLDTYGSRVDALLDDAKMTPEEKAAFHRGLDKGFGRRVGPTKIIRALDIDILTQQERALGFLDVNWGKWKPSLDGQLLWVDEGLKSQFEQITAKLQSIGKQQMDEQARLAELLK